MAVVMARAVDLARFAAALLCSGVFWATFLFLMDASAFNRRVPFLGVGAAVGVLAVAAHLFVRVVAGQSLLQLLR
jgi:hypothetical protein